MVKGRGRTNGLLDGRMNEEGDGMKRAMGCGMDGRMNEGGWCELEEVGGSQ